MLLSQALDLQREGLAVDGFRLGELALRFEHICQIIEGDGELRMPTVEYPLLDRQGFPVPCFRLRRPASSLERRPKIVQRIGQLQIIRPRDYPVKRHRLALEGFGLGQFAFAPKRSRPDYSVLRPRRGALCRAP